MLLQPADFWWRHVRWPLLAFLPLAAVLATTNIDEEIARSLFFDPQHGSWLGSHSWWVNEAVHTGGRWAIRVLVAIAALAWLGAYRRRQFRVLRRPLGYFVVSMTLSVGCVGLLKTLTNVDCPWDLLPFGGQYPLVHLFADRPDLLKHAHCFPAAHASSGYALVALYFVWRERSATLARLGLYVGLVAGLVFGVAQQSRGAHFISHDMWSAFIVWLVAASVYAFGFGARLTQIAGAAHVGNQGDSLPGSVLCIRQANEQAQQTAVAALESSEEQFLVRHEVQANRRSCRMRESRRSLRHFDQPGAARVDRNRREFCEPSRQRCPR